MKVKELKELLEEKLQMLEEYEDDDEIKMETNTYFLDGAKHFLGIAGYDGGYINLEYIDVEKEEEDYE